jgi:hypothetical protein
LETYYRLTFEEKRQQKLKMLEYYGLATIPGAHDLQRGHPNSRKNYPPSLYALFDHYIGTKTVKKPRNSIRCDSWSEFPLNNGHIKYLALDARLSFEIARKHWHLVAYDSIMDHLNVEMMQWTDITGSNYE